MHFFHTETFYRGILREMKFQLHHEIMAMDEDAQHAGELDFSVQGLWSVQSWSVQSTEYNAHVPFQFNK